MKRKRTFLAAAAAAAVLASASPAGAAEAAGSGWWTSAPVAVAPDAEDALVVQGGPPDQPVSYAAVQFTLDEGETPSMLELEVAEGSGSTPGATLSVCPLTGTFSPADGGAMADAPPYDCATKVSAPATEGVYSFDVSTMGGGTGALSLAILPDAPSRVVLARPGSDALVTTSGGGSASAFDSGGSFDSGSFGSGTAPADQGSFSEPSTAAYDVPSTEVPTVEPSVVGDDSSTPSEAAAPAAMEPASVTGDDGGLSVGPFALVFLVLLAMGLWAAAGRMAEQPGTATPEPVTVSQP